MNVRDERDGLQAMLQRTNWAFPLVVLVACVVVGLAVYWLGIRPLVEASIDREEARATQGLAARLGVGVVQVERQLRSLADLSRTGMVPFDDPARAGKVMASMLRQEVIANIIVAHDDGRELLLRRTSEGYTVRVTDVARWGPRKRVFAYAADSSLVSDSWIELDYDPRTRPWFQGALRTPSLTAFWSDAYRFFATKEPGITLATRTTDERLQGAVVAIDIRLADLSALTASFKYGKRGFMAMLDSSQRMLAVPPLPQFADYASVQRAVLTTPAESAVPLLAQALEQIDITHQEDGEVRRTFIEADGERWRVTFNPATMGTNRNFIVGAVPESDFSPVTPRMLASMLTVFLIIGVVILVGTRRYARRFSTPIARAFNTLAASQDALTQQVEIKTFLGELTRHLQDCGTLPEVGARALTSLAERFGMRQGLLAVSEQGSRLTVVQRYGAPPDDRAKAHYAPGEGLPGQCLRDRQIVHVAVPDDPDWIIRSGLGSMPPAELWVLPIEYSGQLVGVGAFALIRPLPHQDIEVLKQAMMLVGMRIDDLAGGSGVAA